MARSDRQDQLGDIDSRVEVVGLSSDPASRDDERAEAAFSGIVAERRGQTLRLGVAAAVLAAGVVVTAVLPDSDRPRTVDLALEPSPIHSPARTPRPTRTPPRREPPTALRPGPNGITVVAPLRITIDVPAGWYRERSAPDDWVAWSGVGLVGVTSQASIPCISRLGHDEAVVDGLVGRLIEFTQSSACRPNDVLDTLIPNAGARGPATTMSLFLLDVDGVSLVMFAATPGSFRPHHDELRGIVASAAIEAPTQAGLIGLPPPGASPSVPDAGTLVDSYPVYGDGGGAFDGLVRLYADGRLIWYEFYDGPAGPNGHSTGYVEQRLTKVGVDLVLGHGSLLEKDPLHLPDWLPASAWEDRQMKPYLPSGYGICLSELRDPTTVLVPRLVAMLPPAAADLLRGREPLPTDGSWGCLPVTTDEARELDAALRAAGATQDAQSNRYVLEYRIDVLGMPHPLVVMFEPRFPDGTVGCSGCG